MADKSSIATVSVMQADIIPFVRKTAVKNFFYCFSTGLAELSLE